MCISSSSWSITLPAWTTPSLLTRGWNAATWEWTMMMDGWGLHPVQHPGGGGGTSRGQEGLFPGLCRRGPCRDLGTGRGSCTPASPGDGGAARRTGGGGRGGGAVPSGWLSGLLSLLFHVCEVAGKGSFPGSYKACRTTRWLQTPPSLTLPFLPKDTEAEGWVSAQRGGTANTAQGPASASRAGLSPCSWGGGSLGEGEQDQPGPRRRTGRGRGGGGGPPGVGLERCRNCSEMEGRVRSLTPVARPLPLEVPRSPHSELFPHSEHLPPCSKALLAAHSLPTPALLREDPQRLSFVGLASCPRPQKAPAALKNVEGCEAQVCFSYLLPCVL